LQFGKGGPAFALLRFSEVSPKPWDLQFGKGGC
jgi:hypothetical protein